MNGKRIQIEIGLLAAGIAVGACARHCRRATSGRRGAGHALSCGIPSTCDRGWRSDEGPATSCGLWP